MWRRALMAPPSEADERPGDEQEHRHGERKFAEVGRYWLVTTQTPHNGSENGEACDGRDRSDSHTCALGAVFFRVGDGVDEHGTREQHGSAREQREARP